MTYTEVNPGVQTTVKFFKTVLSGWLLVNKFSQDKEELWDHYNIQKVNASPQENVNGHH